MYKICVVFFILSLSLSACSTSKKYNQHGTMLPMPKIEDPADAYAHAAVQKFLADTGAPEASTYDMRRLDLNHDGRRDAFILFKTPYGYWCGLHGCTMLIMKAYNNHFELVNSIQPVRRPLYISDRTTNGWQNLILRVSGRWNRAKDVILRFDGNQYPSNPSKIRGADNIDYSFYPKLF